MLNNGLKCINSSQSPCFPERLGVVIVYKAPVVDLPVLVRTRHGEQMAGKGIWSPSIKPLQPLKYRNDPLSQEGAFMEVIAPRDGALSESLSQEYEATASPTQPIAPQHAVEPQPSASLVTRGTHQSLGMGCAAPNCGLARLRRNTAMHSCNCVQQRPGCGTAVQCNQPELWSTCSH